LLAGAVDSELGRATELTSFEPTHSHVPRKVAAHEDGVVESVVNITSHTSNDSNAVEINGIRFKILMLERVLRVPTNQPGANTPVLLGLRIANNTSAPVRFRFYSTPIPEILSPERQLLQGGRVSDFVKKPLAFDFPLIRPGESADILPNTRLYSRKNNRFALNISDEMGGFWVFEDLKLGTYKIRFKYENFRTNALYFERCSDVQTRLEGLWTGEITTPFVEFRLIERSK
jgi:hypothetical protein